MNKIKHCGIKTLRKTVLALLQINGKFFFWFWGNLCLILFLETSHTSQKKFWTGAFENSRFTPKNFTFNACCVWLFLKGESLM